jgi:hypothetical protein
LQLTTSICRTKGKFIEIIKHFINGRKGYIIFNWLTSFSGHGLLGIFNQEAAETIVEEIAMVNSMAEAV